LRQKESACIIGDDNLAHLGLKIGGFCDHPDAGFWSFRTRHHSSNVVGVYQYTTSLCLLGCTPLPCPSFCPSNHAGGDHTARHER
jgi:hypothetical protein